MPYTPLDSEIFVYTDALHSPRFGDIKIIIMPYTPLDSESFSPLFLYFNIKEQIYDVKNQPEISLFLTQFYYTTFL